MWILSRWVLMLAFPRNQPLLVRRLRGLSKKHVWQTFMFHVFTSPRKQNVSTRHLWLNADACWVTRLPQRTWELIQRAHPHQGEENQVSTRQANSPSFNKCVCLNHSPVRLCWGKKKKKRHKQISHIVGTLGQSGAPLIFFTSYYSIGSGRPTSRGSILLMLL